MKLKSILAFAVACGSALMMSVAANAAQEVKAEGVTLDEEGAIVPIVFNTTETDLTHVEAFGITINYDVDKWEFYGCDDVNTYIPSGRNPQPKPMGTMMYNEAECTDGTVEISYACGGSNGFPTVTDGKVTLAEVYFLPKDGTTSATDNDFTVGVTHVSFYDAESSTTLRQNGTDMNSFFTFDVTGDLGGNEIVGLAASTDGGVTKQELTKYVSTDLAEDATEFDTATTTFLVAVNKNGSSVGEDAITDITIYGIKEDGTYVPLTSLDQKDFLVQTFYRA